MDSPLSSTEDPKAVHFSPRPHTRPPDPVHLVELDSHSLLEWDNPQIVNWAYLHLGLVMDARMPKQKLINELLKYAESTFST